jgi:hypothetical protein
MKSKRIKLGKYILGWALLLQMINLSVDPMRHANLVNGSYTFQEDLKINKIESLSEIILEKLFKKDVPETQDNQQIGLIKVAFVLNQQPIYLPLPFLTAIPVTHNHNYLFHLAETSLALESPPPQC